MSSARKLLSLQAIFIVVFSLCNQNLSASLRFCNNTSRIVIDCDQDRVRLGQTGSIFGFEENSIVQKFGFNSPSDWTESYTNGVVVGVGRICPSTYLVENNSNAIKNIFDEIINNSNAIIKKCDEIKHNSDAILAVNISTGDLSRFNSNLLLTKCQDIQSNSNAIAAHDIRILENKTNITQNITDIAANVIDIRHNSNALVYCCNNNSNAIISLDDRVAINEADIAQNTVDIANNVIDIRHNSNALLYCCKNNSNALLYGIKNNSNALIYCCNNNSSAIISLDNRVTINEADIAQNAVDIANNVIDIRHNSNALLYCCKNNSNALLYGIKNNSNALIYCCNNNSNAIIKLRADLSTIDSLVPDIDICTSTFDLMFDLWISVDNILTVQTKAGPDVCIDGRGHYIHFSRNAGDIWVIEPGLCVTTKNVVLKDFSDKILNIDSTSTLKFGEGTVVELADCERLKRDWTFGDNSVLSGFGNELILGNYAIEAQGNANIILHDVCLADVRENNMRSRDENSCITLKDATICLSRNFSYTRGALRFRKDVVVTGTSQFIYSTAQTSTIEQKSHLLLDKHIQFCYAPERNNRDLIYMEDETSRFFWYHCSIKSTATGMRLTRGTLCVDGYVTVNADGLSTSEAIAFGNGVVDDDLSIVIEPAAVMDLQVGIITYDNVA